MPTVRSAATTEQVCSNAYGQQRIYACELSHSHSERITVIRWVRVPGAQAAAGEVLVCLLVQISENG